MRTIKELLIILIEEFKNTEYAGICSAVFNLWIIGKFNTNEMELLSEFIHAHRPPFKPVDIHAFWWVKYNKSPRVKFLNKLLSSCEN